MSRLKLSEYRAKTLLMGDSYAGISVDLLNPLALPKRGRFVVKVDQGVKKRFVRGLVALNVGPRSITPILKSFKKKGYVKALIEPYVPHLAREEKYLSLERMRDGVQLLFAEQGGVEVEQQKKVQKFLISTDADAARVSKAIHLPPEFVRSMLNVFNANHFSFVEINPLVVKNKMLHVLDMAVLVDSAGEFFANDAWNDLDIVRSKASHRAEEAVEILAKTTAASLRLTVLNPKGSLFFLLSGGGGSLVIADETGSAAALVGNYGEYSGGPTREETYLYTKEILALLFSSPAKKKALVIAGGIANFTDIKSTFEGIIDALSEHADLLRKQKVNIFVRRGGPNEKEGLALMRSFLKQSKLAGAVYGGDAAITKAVEKAVAFVQS